MANQKLKQFKQLLEPTTYAWMVIRGDIYCEHQAQWFCVNEACTYFNRRSWPAYFEEKVEEAREDWDGHVYDSRQLRGSNGEEEYKTDD